MTRGRGGRVGGWTDVPRVHWPRGQGARSGRRHACQSYGRTGRGASQRRSSVSSPSGSRRLRRTWSRAITGARQKIYRRHEESTHNSVQPRWRDDREGVRGENPIVERRTHGILGNGGTRVVVVVVRGRQDLVIRPITVGIASRGSQIALHVAGEDDAGAESGAVVDTAVVDGREREQNVVRIRIARVAKSSAGRGEGKLVRGQEREAGRGGGSYKSGRRRWW